VPAMSSSPLEVGPTKFSEEDVKRRLTIVGFGGDDAARIAKVRTLVAGKADEFTEVFFDYLAKIADLPALSGAPAVLEDAKRQKRAHMVALVAGRYDAEYVAQRLSLGRIYSKAGVGVPVFLGAFHHLMRAIGTEIMRMPGRDPQESFLDFMAVKKIAFLDIGLIVDVLIEERERTIRLQQDAIRELSTPVLQVRDGLLILPIIGVLDSQRAKQLTDSLLHSIRLNRARVVVMDITGVAAVDSKVANHLIQTVAAARLMGASVIISGLSAEVAQALVALGVDLSKINTVGDLEGGLEEAERVLGYKVSLVERAG